MDNKDIVVIDNIFSENGETILIKGDVDARKIFGRMVLFYRSEKILEPLNSLIAALYDEGVKINSIELKC